MFYRPEDGHGLPHNPFYAVVSPRPIGWISTRSPATGDNLAPYSFFNAVSSSPPQVMFAGAYADSVSNALDTGVFAVNLVEEASWLRMNETSAQVPPGVDEFALAGVARAECQTIDCPRVADAPATLECRVSHVLELANSQRLIVGLVTGVHLRDDCLRDGRFDVTTFTPVSRLGYMDYSFVRELHALKRPK